jgi:HEAT repeat protein
MVQRCAQHKRAGMRALGAHLALHLPTSAALSTLIGLLQDPQAMVRGSAWQALSQFNLSRADWRKLQPRWQSIGQETDRGIRALASSLALRHAPDEALPVLRLALNAMGQADRLKTIGAVLRSGPAGLPLLEEIAEHHGDRYMRINARIGCLMHRQQPALHLERLQEELAELNERIMPLQQSSGLLAIGPSEVGHFPGIPNLPEAMDLMARLRLAHLIRACGGRLPVEQITSWLEERRWGLSAAAAQLLVSEGDAAAAQVVRDMLQHSSPRVRFQAAMVLAVVARDEAALDDLVEAAHSQDPEIELQVVGAAGSLASRKLLPFLVRKLADPSPQMRLQAASSILQILNEVSRV